MPLTPEQIKELKKQLSQQIQHLPEEQRKQAQEQIDSMSHAALEAMIKQQQAHQTSGSEKGVFRMIIDGEIKAKKVNENKDAIAVLDIRPVSKGHVIVIPKKAVVSAKALPNQAFTLAKTIANKIVSKLKASSTEIQTETKFGEIIINVIPIYEQSLNISSPRYEAKEEEIEDVSKKLRVIEKPKIEKVKTEKKKETEVLKLKRRVP